jgi:hypothetical protein
MVSDHYMFKFYVLSIVTKNNKGTEHVLNYCLLASKAFISTWFLLGIIQTTSLEFYKAIVFIESISSYFPFNPFIIST